MRVGDGPARGDLAHWRYELFDLAPLLKPGQNLITATVWNWGVYAALAQMIDRTAFLLESEATGDADISTPKEWQVETEPGHTALDRSSIKMWTYFASGPGEEIDAAKYDWNWNSPDDKNPAWVAVASPMRDSIFAQTARAHSADVTHGQQLVAGAGPAAAYGVSARRVRATWRAFPSQRIKLSQQCRSRAQCRGRW